MTLDELKATAPRSFDKLLVDLLVAVQAGERPIADVREPEPDPRVAVLEREVASLKAALSALFQEARAA